MPVRIVALERGDRSEIVVHGELRRNGELARFASEVYPLAWSLQFDSIRAVPDSARFARAGSIARHEPLALVGDGKTRFAYRSFLRRRR